MTRWRLLPLALFVAALLGVVAVAARGRPLGLGGYGSGPSSGFFDYAYTSILIVLVLFALVAIAVFVAGHPGLQPKKRRRRNPLATLAYIVMCGLVIWGLASSGFERRLHRLEQRLHIGQKLTEPSAAPGLRARHPAAGHGVRLRWDEVAIVLALLGALGVAAFAARRRPGSRSWQQLASQAAVSAALDESLDDLRSEPDLRKAIIASYARMERALATAGLPRRPSEAPLEYLERALEDLETSAAAIRRLTDLFEWARFSQHEPEQSMRDEAIDALEAVRDELRAPTAVPVTA